jgi:hypothetical protein
LYVHAFAIIVLVFAAFALGVFAHRWLAPRLSRPTTDQQARFLPLPKAEDCARLLIPRGRLEKELESVLSHYVRDRVARSAEDVRLALSDDNGLEVASKLLELAEKMRLVVDDETFLRNAQDLFNALTNAIGSHQDGAAGGVWTAALGIATASAFATFGAWTALLTCIRGLQDSGFNKKMLSQLVTIHKRENHGNFAAGYSLARAGILVRRIDSQQFAQSRRDIFLSKWMWFEYFEMEVAAARNYDDLVATWGNLYFALLAVSTDFCLCDLVGEADRFACDLPSDVEKLKHARRVLLQSKIAEREPGLVKRVLGWIDASIVQLEYLSSAIDRISAAHTLEVTGKSGSFRKAEEAFMAWVAKTRDHWNSFRETENWRA